MEEVKGQLCFEMAPLFPLRSLGRRCVEVSSAPTRTPNLRPEARQPVLLLLRGKSNFKVTSLILSTNRARQCAGNRSRLVTFGRSPTTSPCDVQCVLDVRHSSLPVSSLLPPSELRSSSADRHGIIPACRSHVDAQPPQDLRHLDHDPPPHLLPPRIPTFHSHLPLLFPPFPPLDLQGGGETQRTRRPLGVTDEDGLGRGASQGTLNWGCRSEAEGELLLDA